MAYLLITIIYMMPPPECRAMLNATHGTYFTHPKRVLHHWPTSA